MLGYAGAPSTDDDVAALVAALGADRYWAKGAREEADLAATRLRIRHHWEYEDAVRTLRTMEGGTWAREDQSKWLRQTFREKDPEGWARFLIEEATRPDAQPDGVAAAAAGLKDLPPAESVPLLQSLLGHASSYVRLEAALALHDIDPDDPGARGAVARLALDRSIVCGWRPDLTNRWSRNRALTAALDWKGLSTAALRAHLIAPEPDDPEFISTAVTRLASTPDALTTAEVRDAWRRLLDGTSARHILAAVRYLKRVGDVESKTEMLAALDRLARRIVEVGAKSAGTSSKVVGRWRDSVRELSAPEDAR